MKKNLLLFALFSFFLLSACQKTNTVTQGQLNASKLQKEVKETIINSIWVSNILNFSTIYTGKSISFTGDGFAIISSSGGSKTFNLDQLKAYDLSTGNLNLYF